VWVTNGSGDGVEPVGGLGVEAVHEVSVAVDGDLYGGVSESGLDGFGVFSGGDEPDRSASILRSKLFEWSRPSGPR
jgi:hypothetical protein